MGEVFRARDPRFNRDVAIKAVHPYLAGDGGVAPFQCSHGRTVRSSVRLCPSSTRAGTANGTSVSR
jgi:hypothetical protein